MNYYVAGVEFSSENSLTHHGIKGQKWGVRRFQNPDGSLTDAGRKRISRQDARKALGYSDDKRLDLIEREYASDYRKNINKSNKLSEKAEKQKSKGKDPSKYVSKAQKYMESANAIKSNSKKYSTLSNKDKALLNGMKIVSDVMTFGALSTVGKDKKNSAMLLLGGSVLDRGRYEMMKKKGVK